MTRLELERARQMGDLNKQASVRAVPERKRSSQTGSISRTAKDGVFLKRRVDEGGRRRDRRQMDRRSGFPQDARRRDAKLINMSRAFVNGSSARMRLLRLSRTRSAVPCQSSGPEPSRRLISSSSADGCPAENRRPLGRCELHVRRRAGDGATRHVRVYGETRGRPHDRCASGYVGYDEGN